jgi:hypothetical protein
LSTRASSAHAASIFERIAGAASLTGAPAECRRRPRPRRPRGSRSRREETGFHASEGTRSATSQGATTLSGSPAPNGVAVTPAPAADFTLAAAAGP